MLKKVDCAARGGLNLGSCYLISGLGITAAKNLDLLHCLAGMLERVSGPWIIGGDFNCTPEELTATGWLKVVGVNSPTPDDHAWGTMAPVHR